MHQRIRMPQIIQKSIPQSLPQMCSRYQSRDIQKFNWNAPLSINTGPVVRFTSVREFDTSAGAFDLEVADGALGVYSCKSEVVESGTPSQNHVESMRLGSIRRHVVDKEKGLSYGKFPVKLLAPHGSFCYRSFMQSFYGPTLEVASVKLPQVCMSQKEHLKEGWRGNAHLLRVVDFPEEGLPTSPINGSRGIMDDYEQEGKGT
jgi:hypothetical protein